MSNEALNDIQKALNVIRNATDNEQYTTKVKALELITQSLLSHIQERGLVPRGRNLSKKKASSNMPKPLPIPKSPNAPKAPKSNNNPNAPMPTAKSRQVDTPSPQVNRLI